MHFNLAITTYIFSTVIVFFSTPRLWGFDREKIIFSIRSQKTWFSGTKTILSIKSDKVGQIAEISSDKQRSQTQYGFKIYDGHPISHEDANQAILKLKTVHQFNDVFSEIGSPQLGLVTVWNEIVYGLILMTGIETEVPPSANSTIVDSKGIDSSPPSPSKSSAIGGGAGTNFGGVYYPNLPITAAALVRWNDSIPEILKVYEFAEPLNELQGYSMPMNVQNVIAKYAYSNFRKDSQSYQTLICRRTLSTGN